MTTKVKKKFPQMNSIVDFIPCMRWLNEAAALVRVVAAQTSRDAPDTLPK